MAKKTDATGLRIVIEMPEEDGIQRNGTLIASYKEHAVIESFTYAYGQADIAIQASLQAVFEKLAEYDQSPIELPDSKDLKKRPAPAPATKPDKAKQVDTPDWMKPAFGKGAKKFAPTPRTVKK